MCTPVVMTCVLEGISGALVSSVGSLPPAATLAGAGIVGLLAVASAGVALKIRIAPRKDDSQLRLRMVTWWWIVGLLLAALAIGQAATIVFLAFVSFLALREYLSLIPTTRRDRRVLWWTYALLVAQYAVVYLRAYNLFLTLIPAWGLLILSSRMLLGAEPRGFTQRLSTLHFGLLLTVYNLSHLAYLTVLPVEGVSTPAGGAGLLMFLLALTELNDVAQYIWGRSFGRHKVSPTISPNKTVEGLLGGILTTAVLGGVFGHYLTPLDGLHGAAVGLAVAVAGFLGDLGISALKRDLGVKDTGTVLPGHGGVLDRVDSLTLTAPVYFHLMRLMFFSGGHT